MARGFHGRRWLAILPGLLLVCSSVQAAEITDVIDAADEDVYDGKIVEDLFDFHIEPTFKQTYEQAKITREANCTGGADRCQNEDTILINKELRYQRVVNELDLEFELSIYKDLEFHVLLPIIFSDTTSLKYAKNAGKACEFDIDPYNPKCVDETNSTVDPSDNRIVADAGDGNDFTTYRYFDVPDENDKWLDGPGRGGLGDLTFGIDWSPFNDQRDQLHEDPWCRNNGRSTLTLGFDYTAPTAAVMKADPKNENVGRGVHELGLHVATSRRFNYVDPYMQFSFALPIPTDSIFKDYGGGQERVGPGPSGDLTFGIEIVPWEQANADFQQKFIIDLRGHFTYVGEGRDFGPFFDALGSSACQSKTLAEVQPGGASPECGWLAEKWSNAGFENLRAIDQYSASYDPNHTLKDDGLTSYEGYGRFGASLGFNIQPIQYVQIRAGLGLDHNQEHFLTFGKAGTDVRGRVEIEPGNPSAGTRPDDSAPKDGTVSFDDIKERNPVYNPTYDSVGSRFRIEEWTVFTWNVGLAFQF